MAEQVLDGSQQVDLAKHPSGIVPTLQNIVFTVNMDCRLDLKAIALHARNAEYNPKRFAAVIMRIREPKTTALIFASGKMCLAFRLLSTSVIRWKAHQPAVPTCMLSSKRGYTLSCTTRNTSSASADENNINSEEAAEEDPSTNPSAYKNGRFLMLSKVNWLGVFFGFSNDEKPWMVPWTWFTVIQVMFLWFCTFWLVGSWIIPVAAHYLGCSKDTLTYRGQALYSLITDIAEGTVGLGILHRCLARFHPLPRKWFPISWRGQWYMDVLLGCLMFPVVNRLSQINVDLLPFPSPFISSYEQSIMARDPVASILYAVVVSICCPIWEEVIFRGFLLPSLTRYLPMWASILVSAVVFGLAHFNMQRMLPLTFLGLMMGIMFVRSRNLLSSMFLHSLWNGFVFIGLLR